MLWPLLNMMEIVMQDVKLVRDWQWSKAQLDAMTEHKRAGLCVRVTHLSVFII